MPRNVLRLPLYSPNNILLKEATPFTRSPRLREHLVIHREDILATTRFDVDRALQAWTVQVRGAGARGVRGAGVGGRRGGAGRWRWRWRAPGKLVLLAVGHASRVPRPVTYQLPPVHPIRLHLRAP